MSKTATLLAICQLTRTRAWNDVALSMTLNQVLQFFIMTLYIINQTWHFRIIPFWSLGRYQKVYRIKNSMSSPPPTFTCARYFCSISQEASRLFDYLDVSPTRQFGIELLRTFLMVSAYIEYGWGHSHPHFCEELSFSGSAWGWCIADSLRTDGRFKPILGVCLDLSFSGAAPR